MDEKRVMVVPAASLQLRRFIVDMPVSSERGYIFRVKDLRRLDRLLGQLLRRSLRQNIFEPWELEFLLKVSGVPRVSNRTLRKYQRTVRRGIQNGNDNLSLTDFLEGEAGSLPPGAQLAESSGKLLP